MTGGEDRSSCDSGAGLSCLDEDEGDIIVDKGDSHYSETAEGSYHGYHYSPDQKEEEPYQPAWFEQEGGGAQD